jgi:hypothetical protein
MKIRFTVGMEDLVEFTQFCNDTSSPIDKHRRILIVIYIAFNVVLALMKHSLSMLYFVAGFTVIAIWHFRSSQKVTLKQVQHWYAGGKNLGVFGEHELELLSDGIRHTNSVNDTKQKFAGIERVEITPSHVFIFISSISAYVISKTKVSEGDLDAFATDLKEKLQASVSS